MGFEIFVRNERCLPQQALSIYSTLELNYTFQDAGSWVLKMPHTPDNPDVEAMFNAYRGGKGLGGIIVTQDGEIIFSGPITGFEADGDFTSIQDQATVTFFGIDDTGLLSYRLCMVPDPAGLPLPPVPPAAGYPFIAPSNQGWGYWPYGIKTSTDPADGTRTVSQCMYNLVSNNIGPTAPFNLNPIYANRRIREIVLAGNNNAYGPTYSTRSRYENLLEELKIASVYIPDTPFNYSVPQRGPYEGLGFNIQQVGGTQNLPNPAETTGILHFSVFEPNDLTSSVVFSKGFGNLASYRYTNHAPEGNFCVLGGMNNAARNGAPFNVKNRFFFHAAAPVPSVDNFGLREFFLDRRDIQYPLVQQQPNRPPNPYAQYPRPATTAPARAANVTYNQMAAEAGRAMQEAFFEKRNLIDIEIETINIQPTRFLVDFNVGDKVSVILNGFPNPITAPSRPLVFEERVRKVTLSLTYPDAVKITCRIGSQPAGNQYNLFKKIKNSRERIAHLDSQY